MFLLEWFIRQLWSLSIISCKIAIIAHNHYTHNNHHTSLLNLLFYHSTIRTSIKGLDEYTHRPNSTPPSRLDAEVYGLAHALEDALITPTAPDKLARRRQPVKSILKVNLGALKSSFFVSSICPTLSWIRKDNRHMTLTALSVCYQLLQLSKQLSVQLQLPLLILIILITHTAIYIYIYILYIYISIYLYIYMINIKMII